MPIANRDSLCFRPFAFVEEVVVLVGIASVGIVSSRTDNVRTPTS